MMNEAHQNIPANVGIGTNYQLTAATPETLARILCESLGLPVNGTGWRQFLNKDGTGVLELLLPRLLMTLRNYKGLLLPELTIEHRHNLVPKTLRKSMAQRNAGVIVTPTFDCNYLALGDGTTAKTENDTALENETLRGEFTNRYPSGVTAYLDKFFSTAEVGGNTYNEAGIIVDGTASADTGLPLSLVSISQNIAINQTLSVNASVTYSSL